jgi:hypothetical protein
MNALHKISDQRYIKFMVEVKIAVTLRSFYTFDLQPLFRSGGQLVSMSTPQATSVNVSPPGHRPHQPARRDRRRPLPDVAHRRRALPRRGGAFKPTLK